MGVRALGSRWRRRSIDHGRGTRNSPSRGLRSMCQGEAAVETAPLKEDADMAPPVPPAISRRSPTTYGARAVLCSWPRNTTGRRHALPVVGPCEQVHVVRLTLGPLSSGPTPFRHKLLPLRCWTVCARWFVGPASAVPRAPALSSLYARRLERESPPRAGPAAAKAGRLGLKAGLGLGRWPRGGPCPRRRSDLPPGSHCGSRPCPRARCSRSSKVCRHSSVRVVSGAGLARRFP